MCHWILLNTSFFNKTQLKIKNGFFLLGQTRSNIFRFGPNPIQPWTVKMFSTIHSCKVNSTEWIKGAVVSWKVVFRKLFFKLSCVCLPLEKLVNGKHFPVKEKFDLVSRKVFFFYFGRKTLSGSCEKFRNVILFADYIKFGPQTFDCYIHFLFWIFVFQFHPLEFNFYINFGPYFYFAFFLSFFNWNFLSIKFGPHSFDCYLFYLK